MKSILMWAASALLLFAPPVVQDANAQLEVTLGGGINSPKGDYGDEVNTGYTLVTGVGYRVFPHAVIGGELSYSGNKAPDEITQTIGSDYDAKSSILQYGLAAKLLLPVGVHNMYAKGSFGNYRGTATVSGNGQSASLTLTDLGYALGGGFNFNSGSSALFADVSYHQVDFEGDSNTSFLAFTVGALIRFDFNKPEHREDVQSDIDKLYQ